MPVPRERAAVEAVDAALVAAAKALAKVADGKRVSRVMAELNSSDAEARRGLGHVMPGASSGPWGW